MGVFDPCIKWYAKRKAKEAAAEAKEEALDAVGMGDDKKDGSDEGGSGFSTCKKVTLAICAFVKLGVAITVLAIVGDKLYDVTWYSYTNIAGEVVFTTTKCLMWDTPKDGDVCEYAYAVGGLSIILTLLLLIFLCVPSCGGFCTWVELILHAFMLAWWIVASIVFTDKAKPANDLGLPNESYRNGVVIVSWIAVLFSGFAVLVCLIDSVMCLAKCCCGGKGGKKEKKKEATAA